MTDTEQPEPQEDDVQPEPPAAEPNVPEEPSEFYPSPAHRQIWEAYRAHPVVQRAQAESDRRARELDPIRQYVLAQIKESEQRHNAVLAELQPLRDHYNDEITRAKIQFQATAQEPITLLTKALTELDARQSAAQQRAGNASAFDQLLMPGVSPVVAPRQPGP